MPDQITLDSDEILSLLDGGAQALQEGATTCSGRATSTAPSPLVSLEARSRSPREEPLQDGLFGPQTLFGFQWQLALHGDPLTPAEMDELARTTSPVIKLRDHWVAVDSRVIKRARKRLIRNVTPVQALAATLTGVVEVEDLDFDAIVGASLLPVRERVVGAATGAPVPVPEGLAADLRDYQHQGLTWLARPPPSGWWCAGRRHGPGKTVQVIALHLHRAELGRDTDAARPAQPVPGAARPAPGGPTLVVCPTSLLGNWEAEIRRFAPGVPVRRHHGATRDLDVDAGFVLTTYGTMRNDAPALARVPWTSWWPTRPNTSRTRGPRPPGRCARSRAERGWR